MSRIPDHLISALSSRTTKDLWLETMSQGFHIWGTLGLDVVLREDGTLLKYEWSDGDDRNGQLLPIDDTPTRLVALRVARRNVPELSSLLPTFGGSECPECSELVDKAGVFLVCEKCAGTGYVK